MLEVADIIRRHGAAYCARYGPGLRPEQRRSLRDLVACRTPALGGHVYACDHCGQRRYAYHSCRNRHCPKCHREETARWLAQQRGLLLPCAYFLLTFTLPAALRPLARDHPKAIYGLLMQCAVAALQTLARDPRYLGGRPGCLAVLHTWTRALLYHPHVHLLVTAGGLSPDRTQWIPSKNPKYLVPVEALSVIFRAKMCAALKRANLLSQVPSQVWNKDWVVHCQPAGSGRQVLDYLGRYVFRIAITNSRLEPIQNGQVTFRYRESRSQKLRRLTLPALEFIARFLEHVLPPGCAKVRYYGIWAGSCQKQREQARALLSALPSNPLRSFGPRRAAAGVSRGPSPCYLSPLPDRTPDRHRSAASPEGAPMTTRCQPLVSHRSALSYRRQSAAVCPWPFPKHHGDPFPTPSPLRRAHSSG